jgi:carbon monoxide dehydrogenase subunit G
MKLEGDFLFDAPVAMVWEALFDPVVLAAVMPGCEKLDRVDGRYQGELNIKVGPIQGKFGGKVDLKDIEEPRSYTMLVEGRGAPGFVKASAAVRLEAEGAGTRLRYDADAQVGGKIASVGQRLLEASARAISKQSLEGLNENIKLRAAAKAVEASRREARTAAPGGVAIAEPRHAEGADPAPVPQAAPLGAAPGEGTTDPPVDEPPRGPVVVKSISQTALAASIAKEVTRSLLPRPVLVALAIGFALVIGWWLVRR